MDKFGVAPECAGAEAEGVQIQRAASCYSLWVSAQVDARCVLAVTGSSRKPEFSAGHPHDRPQARDDYAMRALADELFNEVICGRMTPKEAGDQLDAAGVPFEVQWRFLIGAAKEIAA